MWNTHQHELKLDIMTVTYRWGRPNYMVCCEWWSKRIRFNQGLPLLFIKLLQRITQEISSTFETIQTKNDECLGYPLSF